MLETTAAYIFWWTAYSFLGWCMEVTRNFVLQKKFMNAGFVFGPFCTIYGVGAVAVVVLLRPFEGNPLAVFALSVLITSTVEYTGHWLLKKLFSLSLWDYSDRAFNLRGRICLFNSIAFGILSLLAIYIIQPFLEGLTSTLPSAAVLTVAAVSVAWFAFDLYNSIFAASKRSHILEVAEHYTKNRLGRWQHRMANRLERLQTPRHWL